MNMYLMFDYDLAIDVVDFGSNKSMRVPTVFHQALRHEDSHNVGGTWNPLPIPALYA